VWKKNILIEPPRSKGKEGEGEMREILFRGKTKENGEWVQGYFVYAKSDFDSEELREADIIPHNTDRVYKGEYNVVFPCIPESIGQYTGLTDKNGNKIFDGDILSIAQIMDGIGKYNFPPLKYPVNVVVIWDKCAWSWKTICKDKRYIHFPDAWCHFECEVIGNIHDNPELLRTPQNDEVRE
jgi:uncharacterized phage protein (TIGR01671 family)